ncbi:nuclease-related domain-containing protein [Clostridium chrysemydis]|uniref:nuclease-related domain-containing protein n=1 Tax=Clostridium chrysemydis TaxID=2665504 RepID=UPI001883DDE7|nr:nuclease-related domain-containing protein [Clostridium chrysemydis]
MESIIILSIIILALVITVKIIETKHKAKLTGYIGERETKKSLSNLKEYRILDDVLLKTQRGTTQIDHILIGPNGVFSIEDKNYSGWIYGDENYKFWTQVIYNKKSRFYNPIWQNKGHVKAIDNIITDKFKVKAVSVIVFSNRCELKKIKAKDIVIKRNMLNKTIKNYSNKKNLTKEEIDNIYYNLSKANILDKKSRKEHLEKVKLKK